MSCPAEMREPSFSTKGISGTLFFLLRVRFAILGFGMELRWSKKQVTPKTGANRAVRFDAYACRIAFHPKDPRS